MNHIRLQVNNLACNRGQRLLFRNISFQLHEGEILLIEGPNGSGKSSLLRLLAGLSTPAEGQIKWYGSELHYLGHANGIKSGLTVEENLHLSKYLSGSASFTLQKETMELLQLNGLKNTFIKNLSAGQKRRVALARFLLIPRQLWILDEPLTALDTSTQSFFLSRLEKHVQQKGIAIVSSHQPMTFHDIVVKSLRLESC